MDRVQQNGGTAGIVAAICLALLFVMYVSTGLDMQTSQDPAKALPIVSQKAGMFGLIGILGMLAAIFGLIFTFGLFSLLRDRAPTRAATLLGLAIVGLTAHALGSAVAWHGGQFLVNVSAKDQTAAGHAWIAVTAVTQGVHELGNVFTGASALVAGWAIIATGAIGSTVGWVAALAGIAEILQWFSASQGLMGLGFLLVVIWLAWGGSQLRRPAAA